MNDNKTNINWYPGHMAKTKRQIIEDLKLVDVVIEILDARIPVSSQNPDISRIIERKKRIVLLNKADLAEENETKKWISYFNNKGMESFAVNANLGNGVKKVFKSIEKMMEEDLQKASKKGRTNKTIRLMIVGIPNVGKSSIINRLANRKLAEVGNKPGVTKQKQWTRISNNMELLDTPGVLWPKFEDDDIALNLSYTGTIKDEIIDKTEITYRLVKKLYKTNKNNLFERYSLTDDEVKDYNSLDEKDDTLLLIELIAKKRGAIVSGGEVDYDKVSNLVLSDFRNGKIGRITLERINGI